MDGNEVTTSDELVKRVKIRVRGSAGIRKLGKIKETSRLNKGGADRLGGVTIDGLRGTPEDGSMRRRRRRRNGR